MRMRTALLSTLLTLVACAHSAPTEERLPYNERPEVRLFVAEMVEEGFDQEVLEATFREAEYQQSIVDAISRPAERTLTWASYQDIFLSDKRAAGGVAFIEKYQDAFNAAEAKYGVPAHIIASIIGVETLYGRITGKYRVIDSLSTLAFDYPPRSKFFRSELKEFFRLVTEEGQAPTAPLGSYAGAMGYGQFISSSYRHYAVDFDGDGVRDIWNNPVDAIGSVANYLARHGWQKGQPIVEGAVLEGEIDESLFNTSLKPNRTIQALSESGISVSLEVDPEWMVTPTRLSGKAGEEYWLGFNNFYVITRYNHSKLYAMAVFQLGERIRAASPG